jgi:hypothetical protein
MTSDAIRSSVETFNEALVIDPEFAPAYAGLADCYAQMGSVRVGMRLSIIISVGGIAQHPKLVRP